MEKRVIPIRLRHSNLKTLHTCERKWQLEVMLNSGIPREESEHLSFGTAYGVGIATYLVTQDQDAAIWQTWYAYWPEIETEKKSIPICLNALMHSFAALDTLLMEYEVAVFDGKPAIEFGFKLNISERYYFTGHIDVILRHRITGVYYILDAKTTGLQLYDLSPLYKNSGQCLGYSIALDRIVGSKQAAYGVIYLAAQIGQNFKVKTHTMVFEKTLMDRLNWFLTLGMDVKRLEMMEDLNVYPQREEGCLHFNRPCKYFGICGLHSLDILRVQEEDKIEYDFVYDLDDLVKDHMARIPSNKLAEII